MKKYIYILFAALVFSSCSDFLDREPKDSLFPGIFWKTEKDAKIALTGCYDGFDSGSTVLYRDCASDNAYNYHGHEGWQALGNGSMSAGQPGSSEFDYVTITKCNEFLENIDKVDFKTDKLKEKYVAEVRFIRAYRYFILTQNYGDVPLVTKTFKTPDESKVPRDPRADVEKFVIDELKDITSSLAESHPGERGRITKSAAQALLARVYLFKEMYTEALQIAKEVKGHKLHPDYEGLFAMENNVNEESILQYEYLPSVSSMSFTNYLPNSGGGWSSVVPLQSLVDNYETIDGLTIEEAKANATYNEENPYKDRDPRLRATIIFPGQLWDGKTFDSLTDKALDHPKKENNSTKSGYNFKKYFSNTAQFPDGYWNTGRSIMIIRYAEVLLTIAEAKVELNKIDNELYDALDLVRERAGMPKVDRTKYNSQSKLRELVRRERRSEFAFEGLRRFDIVRWDITMKVMTGKVYGAKQGTFLTTTQPNGDKDLKLDGDRYLVEERNYTERNNLLPIPQKAIDKNGKLTNNKGYN